MKAWLVSFLIWPCALVAQPFTAEFRVGFFHPTSHLLREIYDEGGTEYEIEIGTPVYNCVDFWANFNGFQREGHSLGLGNRTTLEIFPLSAGLKYNIGFTQRLYGYVGLGISYSWIHIHDQSPFVEERRHANSWGAVGKSGLLYFITSEFFFDVFIDYYYTNASARGDDSSSTNMGGTRAGLGIGVAF